MPVESNYHANVDLKWSLWSKDKAYWDEREPGVWEWMREWYDTSTDSGNPERELKDSPRVVHTAPRKEIRYGKVEISPGFIRVHFWSEYDEDVEEQAPNLFAEIEAETFEAAMEEIDKVEEELLTMEGE